MTIFSLLFTKDISSPNAAPGKTRPGKKRNYLLPPTLTQAYIPNIKNKSVFLSRASTALYLLATSIVIAGMAYLFVLKDKPSLPPESELNLLSTEMISENNWEPKNVNRFFYHWNSLSRTKQIKISRQTWFTEFKKALDKTIATKGNSNVIGSKNNDTEAELLKTLSIVITSKDASSARTESLKNIRKTQSDTARNISAAASRKITRKKPQVKPAANKLRSLNVPTKTAKSKPKSSRPKTSKKPKQEVKTEVEQETRAPGLNSIISQIFQQTVTSETEDADYSFENAGQNESTELLERPDASRNRNQNLATAAELDQIVTQYIVAHDEGDIEKLNRLYSYSARTNTQSGLVNIIEEFKTLLSGTSDRQLFLNDIKWSYKSNRAKGSGNYNALIVYDDDGVKSSSGKFQIIIKKLNNSLLITHFYKTENLK